MKNYTKKIFLLLTLFVATSSAQTFNWSRVDENKKFMVNAKFGMEHGAIFGLEFGYQIKTALFPVILNVEYSFPTGENFLDDFKTKIGGQIRLIEYNNVHFTANIHGVFRRYENDFVRLLNFGADLSGILGYYRNNWFAAAEFGFDKAIVTHFKHSDTYRSQYSGFINGWYQPPTGGNYYYGLQTGVSFYEHDIYLRLGKTVMQDFKTSPMLPVYGQLGYNLKF